MSSKYKTDKTYFYQIVKELFDEDLIDRANGCSCSYRTAVMKGAGTDNATIDWHRNIEDPFCVVHGEAANGRAVLKGVEYVSTLFEVLDEEE